MTMHEEGYIKFCCYLEKTPALIPEEVYQQVNPVRNVLWKHKLIGSYSDGIGFGNISIRDEENAGRFFITGSATGHLRTTDQGTWARVDRWNIEDNTLWCTGPLNASSESMSHAAIYQHLPAVNSVIHIHQKELWSRGLRELPATPASAAYGTPEMAQSIIRLIRDERMEKHGLFVMEGHEEGIMVFGASPKAALEILMHWRNVES